MNKPGSPHRANFHAALQAGAARVADRPCRRERDATPYRLMMMLVKAFATGPAVSILPRHVRPDHAVQCPPAGTCLPAKTEHPAHSAPGFA